MRDPVLLINVGVPAASSSSRVSYAAVVYPVKLRCRKWSHCPRHAFHEAISAIKQRLL